MEKKPKTLERIRAATLQLLEKGGPEAVSIRRVASAVGVTPMALYHYFPDRDSLLADATDAEFDRLAECLRRGDAKRPAFIPPGVRGYLDYALTRPRVFDYLFSRLRKGARRFPSDFRSRKSPTFNWVVDGVQADMRAGKLRRDDVWEVSMATWALAHGLIALYRGGRFEFSETEFRAFYHRSLKRLFHGLRV